MSAIAIRNIDHVVLRAADLDRAIRFYCDVLGCTVERQVESIGLVQMRAGSAMIDLFDAKENPPPGGPGNMDHVALRLETFDEASIQAFLAEHGVPADEAKSRFGAEGDGPSIYIKDPDGNTVELKGPPY
ncbi:MAG: VOC family protein [Alphaproteobacteria bacterium]|nr:VOC family protein [Alphaproteobacteria bacterium]